MMMEASSCFQLLESILRNSYDENALETPESHFVCFGIHIFHILFHILGPAAIFTFKGFYHQERC